MLTYVDVLLSIWFLVNLPFREDSITDSPAPHWSVHVPPRAHEQDRLLCVHWAVPAMGMGPPFYGSSSRSFHTVLWIFCCLFSASRGLFHRFSITLLWRAFPLHFYENPNHVLSSDFNPPRIYLEWRRHPVFFCKVINFFLLFIYYCVYLFFHLPNSLAQLTPRWLPSTAQDRVLGSSISDTLVCWPTSRLKGQSETWWLDYFFIL